MLLRLPENVKIFKVFGEFSILKCGNPLTQAKFSTIKDSTINIFKSRNIGGRIWTPVVKIYLYKLERLF